MHYLKNIIIYLLPGVFVLSSCTKNFQELNAQHDSPSTTTIARLVNGIDNTLIIGGTEMGSVHNDYYFPVTQLTATTAFSAFVLSNGVDEIWTNYYAALQNINLVQDKINQTADQESMKNIQAILYVLKAYKTFRVTDQFGDIPYFNAGKAYTTDVSKFRVGYDSQELIYDSLLNNLTWAVNNIVTDPDALTPAGNAYASLTTFETVLGNDLAKWKKFANSLRLRYAMQMVEKDPTTATPIIQDALTNSAGLIGDNEDIGIWPATMPGVTLGNKWFSVSTGGSGLVRMSSTMWNMVSDGNTDGDIFDPRAKLFVETNQAGNWAPYTIGVSQGDNINAYNGDAGTDPSVKNGALFSLMNWYILHDNSYIPELMMTAAEVHFLKAEAYLRGLGVAQNATTAETEYKAGITSSVNFWYNIAQNDNAANNDWAAAAPPAPTNGDMTTLFNNPKVAFTGSADDNLKKIYAQEWLSFFREPWLAFNLWRRTGKTPIDPASSPSTTYTNFYRLPYSQDEAVNNADNYKAQIAKMGGNTSAVKVWWMP